MLGIWPRTSLFSLIIVCVEPLGLVHVSWFWMNIESILSQGGYSHLILPSFKNVPHFLKTIKFYVCPSQKVDHSWCASCFASQPQVSLSWPTWAGFAGREKRLKYMLNLFTHIGVYRASNAILHLMAVYFLVYPLHSASTTLMVALTRSWRRTWENESVSSVAAVHTTLKVIVTWSCGEFSYRPDGTSSKKWNTKDWNLVENERSGFQQRPWPLSAQA